MNALLSGLAPVQLERIADELRRPGFAYNVDSIIRGFNLGLDTVAIVVETQNSLATLGAFAFAEVLCAVARERRHAQWSSDKRLELVFTGPERDNTATRDTAVVVRELFQSAESDVLVAGYALYNAREIFEPLVQRIQLFPQLRVRVVLNIAASHEQHGKDEVLGEFAHRFRQHHWPDAPLPMVFYDERSFEAQAGKRAVMHAKCVLVDGRRNFVTSANLTEAAQTRNMELGVVINDPLFNRSVAAQFEELIRIGALRQLALA